MLQYVEGWFPSWAFYWQRGKVVKLSASEKWRKKLWKQTWAHVFWIPGSLGSWRKDYGGFLSREFSSFQNPTFTWTLLGVMGFQRAGHHKRWLKLLKGVSWVGGTPVVHLSILESPFSIPTVTCFRMDFWPCCVAPQVSGGQQSRQLQVAQSCVARRWHLREPANGATGDDLWKQDLTTRQPIIYFISIWKVHGYLMIRYTSVCFILQEHLKQSISDIKWYPWKPFTIPKHPLIALAGKWHPFDISWQDSLTAIVHSKVRVKSEETCPERNWSSLHHGKGGWCLVSWSAMISRPGWLVIYIEMARNGLARRSSEGC